MGYIPVADIRECLILGDFKPLVLSHAVRVTIFIAIIKLLGGFKLSLF